MRRTMLACAFGAALGLCAAAPAPLFAAAQAPINIEANRMVSQENSNSVVFMGKVVAKQGGMTIRTDEVDQHIAPEQPCDYYCCEGGL